MHVPKIRVYALENNERIGGEQKGEIRIPPEKTHKRALVKLEGRQGQVVDVRFSKDNVKCFGSALGLCSSHCTTLATHCTIYIVRANPIN